MNKSTKRKLEWVAGNVKMLEEVLRPQTGHWERSVFFSVGLKLNELIAEAGDDRGIESENRARGSK